MKFNPIDISYFSHEERRGQTIIFESPIEHAFQYVYGTAFHERNVLKKIQSYEKYHDHPFYQKILEYKLTPLKSLDPENSICDEVFAEYIVKMANYCNPGYTSRLIKFITLYRECLNIKHKEKCELETRFIEKEFTQITNAEDVPDISNDFITDFIDPDTNSFDFSKEEVIDLTQNFCNWLYENTFSSSKLSLISNY